MSVNATSTHHLAMTTAVARDQAESLASGNARPDETFWREVFEQAGGQAGMVGAGVAVRDGALDGALVYRQAMSMTSSLAGVFQADVPDASGQPAAKAGGPGTVTDSIHARLPEGSAGFPPGILPNQARAIAPIALSSAAGGADALDVPEAPAAALARHAGGAPHALAGLQAPVVVTLAASPDEWRVFLRGQGLTPARAMALASQAVAGAGDAGSALARPVASVTLNGQTIYSTGERGGDDASAPPSFSITA